MAFVALGVDGNRSSSPCTPLCAPEFKAGWVCDTPRMSESLWTGLDQTRCEQIAAWLNEHVGTVEALEDWRRILDLGEGMSVLPLPMVFTVMAAIIIDFVEGGYGPDSPFRKLSDEDQAKVRAAYDASPLGSSLGG